MSEYKAINVNSLNGDSFPVSVDYLSKDGVFCVYLLPLSVLEVINFIHYEKFLIFNVDSYEYEDSRALSLAEIVSKYSSYLTKFDEETLLMNRKSTVSLLNEISHYNFCLIDANKEIEIDKVVQIIDLADKPAEITITDRVGSNVFLSSHDDCYLYVETTDEKLALDLISLQIRTLVSTALSYPIDDLNFNPRGFAMHDKVSVIIPQNPIQTPEETSWKIFDATFRDFIYNRETVRTSSELIYSEADQTIRIKKVRSDETSD